MLLRYLLAFSFRILAMDSGGGVPSKSVMISNWCTTFFPGNNGLPVSISANMHPMLQISIPGVYFEKKEPHSSGARYHLVAT
jgi:Rps23 Pro-64 3,4-dihydroxylase Tpa1-like proline 4-hydroxylase